MSKLDQKVSSHVILKFKPTKQPLVLSIRYFSEGKVSFR